MSPSGVRPPGRSGSPQAVDEIEDLLAIALFAIAGMVAAVGLAVLVGHLARLAERHEHA